MALRRFQRWERMLPANHRTWADVYNRVGMILSHQKFVYHAGHVNAGRTILPPEPESMKSTYLAGQHRTLFEWTHKPYVEFDAFYFRWRWHPWFPRKPQWAYAYPGWENPPHGPPARNWHFVWHIPWRKISTSYKAITRTWSAWLPGMHDHYAVAPYSWLDKHDWLPVDPPWWSWEYP